MSQVIRRLSFSKKLFIFFLLIAFGAAFVIYKTNAPAQAASITWDGGGGTNDWSEGANWVGDVAPGVSDIAVFDGTSTKDATIDSAIDVAGIDVNAGYAGTITQAASITVGESDWDMDAGTFTGGSDPITVTGFINIDNITFTSTSGDLTAQEDFVFSSDATFVHNNGTVIFRADSSARNITVSGGVTMNNVTFNATTATNAHRPTAAGDVTVLGTLTLLDGELDSLSGGEVRAQGTIVHDAGFDGGNGRLVIDTAIAFTPTSGGVLPGVILEDAGASFTGLGAATTTIFEGQVQVTEGTWNAGAGNLELQSGLFLEPAGTFNHDNGTITFTGTLTSVVNSDTSGAGNITLYDVVINKSSATAPVSITAGDVLIVSNSATLTNGELDTLSGTPAGKMRIDGTVSIASTFDGGNGVLDLNVATSLAPSAGSVLPGFTLTNAGADFTGPGSGTVTIEGPVDLVTSTFNAGAGTIAFQEDLIVPAGATFNHDSGTIMFSGTAAKTVNVDSSLTLNNVTLAGGSTNVDAADRLVVNGLLTLTDGTFNDGTIEQRGTFNLAGTFDGGDGEIEFHTLQNISLVNGGDLPGIELLVSGSDVTAPGPGTTVEMDRNIILHSGTTFNAGAGTVILAGGIDVSNGGTFNHDSGTIEIEEGGSLADDDVHSFIGSLTFNNFVNTSTNFNNDFTFEFDNTATFTFLGEFSFDVDSSNPPMVITIRSDSSGSQATLDIQDSSPFITDADVKDINNIGTEVRCSIRCVDSGNNIGWYFGQPGIVVSDISGNTTEAGGTATFTVRLRNEPTANVSVPIASSDVTEGTVSDATLTFTSANWDTNQTITVTGQDDADNDGGVQYTTTVGPASSGDASYDGLEAEDVVIVNEDDDAPANGVDFEDPAAFSSENIAESIGVTWFGHDYYGHGFLMTSSGGTEVNLAGTKVRAGCRIVIGGTEYIIARNWYNQGDFTGYITVTTDPATRPRILDGILNDGAVSSITCAEAGPAGLALGTDDFVHSRSVDLATLNDAAGGYKMVYDPSTDSIWADGDHVFKFDLSNLTYDTFSRQSGFEPGMALDTTRNEVWYPNGTSDTISKFDTTTGSVTHYPTEENCESAIYDSVNDRIWVVCSRASGSPDAVQEINPATGGVVQTVVVEVDNSSGNFNTAGLVYDSTNDRLWVGIDNGGTLVALNAADGSYAFGTLAASTFNAGVPDTSFANIRTPQYVAETNTVWMLNAQCDTGQDDYVSILDASNGELIGYFSVPSCPISSVPDSTNDVIFYSSDHEGTFTEVRMEDNVVIEEHVGMDPGYPVTVDGEGDVWYATCCDPNMLEYVRNGVPAGDYYTSITNDTAQIDTSAWGGVDAVAVNESTAGQSIFYAVSFDARSTFYVFGSQRAIVSDQAAVHGGVQGDYYYRDNANTWAPVPSDTAEEGISLAVAAGANNQMTGTEMEALSSSDWDTLGFTAGTLDIASAIFTDDAHDAPSIQSMEFTVGSGGGGGGGGGSVPVTPENIDISVDFCSPAREVTVTLTGENVAEYLLSEDGSFVDAVWTTFDPNVDGNTMTVTFMLSEGDETKNIYAKFRSSTRNQSETVSDSVVLDEAGQCVDVEPPEEPGEEEPTGELVIGCDGISRPVISEEERATYMFGVAPSGEATPVGLASPASLVRAGDYIRGISFDTVYCITSDMERSPFIDETTYFTHTRSFSQTRWVEDDALSEFSLEEPMLPKEGVVLVKFQSAPEVYIYERDETRITRGTLRWITTEELARSIAGEDWSDYVIDLSPVVFTQFDIAAPILAPIEYDTDTLRRRQLLNESSSEIAIIQSLRQASIVEKVMRLFRR